MIRKATNKDEARVLLIKINSMFLEYLKPVSEEKVAEAMIRTIDELKKFLEKKRARNDT